MVKRDGLVGIAALLAVLTAPVSPGLASYRPASGQAQEFLRTAGTFTAAELARVERGEPIAKVLDTDRREVAIVGAVRIAGSQTKLFERYRNTSSVKASDVVMETGRFSTPPVADDLVGLHFEDYDLDTIRACKPGDCGVRLSTHDMERFAREVN
ncbi:MAG: hypothetical protein JF601_11955, partial [Acidobacteria bacterium]|nr:hypothetical protein [Acidobacteriota bacterium]